MVLEIFRGGAVSKQPLRIGLTGGIGSGKSCAATIFESLGVPVLDLDRVGHSLVHPGSDGLAQLVKVFGSSFLNFDGSLDRAALSAHCFSDSHETAKLNRILHPIIWRAEEAWLKEQNAPYVIIEASVLLESGGADRMDKIIVLLADEEIRLQRVLARGSHDEGSFHAILARQCSDEERRSAATYVIENSGSLGRLQEQVKLIHRQILAL